MQPVAAAASRANEACRFQAKTEKGAVSVFGEPPSEPPSAAHRFDEQSFVPVSDLATMDSILLTAFAASGHCQPEAKKVH
jgi:hypothetical protein